MEKHPYFKRDAVVIIPMATVEIEEVVVEDLKNEIVVEETTELPENYY